MKGDKVARALAIQPMFSQGMVYAPNKDWAELTITEMSVFPAGRRDDLTDSATQALKHIRDIGFGQIDDEVREEGNRAMMHRGRPKRAQGGWL